MKKKEINNLAAVFPTIAISHPISKLYSPYSIQLKREVFTAVVNDMKTTILMPTMAKKSSLTAGFIRILRKYNGID